MESSLLRKQQFFSRLLFLNQSQILDNKVLTDISFVLSSIVYTEKPRRHVGRCHSFTPLLVFQSIQYKVAQGHWIHLLPWASSPFLQHAPAESAPGCSYQWGSASPHRTHLRMPAHVEPERGTELHGAHPPWQAHPELLGQYLVTCWQTKDNGVHVLSSELRKEGGPPGQSIFYLNDVQQAVMRMVVSEV